MDGLRTGYIEEALFDLGTSNARMKRRHDDLGPYRGTNYQRWNQNNLL
jgi:hypothetical protein